MNNYKKLGVSALAGTLASLTAMQAANAGAIDVSGSVTCHTLEETQTKTLVTLSVCQKTSKWADLVRWTMVIAGRTSQTMRMVLLV